MELKLNLLTMSPLDIRRAISMLSALEAWHGHPIAEAKTYADGAGPVATGPAPLPEQSPATVAVTAAQVLAAREEGETLPETKERLKRGRPAKVKDEPPAPIAEPAKPITIDELRAALQRLTARDGMPAGIELLKSYGCNRISELDQKDDAAKRGFIAKCPALAEAEAA